MSEQELLNKIGIEQLKIAKERTDHNTLKKTADMLIEQVEMANSNFSYDQCHQAYQFNGDATIKLEEIIVFINKKIWKYGKCISKNIFKHHKDWFNKDDKRGEYRKIDAIIAANRLIEEN